MKIAICDDNPKDAETIYGYCKACELPYETVIFSSAAGLLEAFSSDFYDLVFLDIEMENPDGKKQPDGYETGVKLSKLNPSPLIVFTTNYSKYAVLGYGIAFRYLCKPITLPVFRHTLDELRPYLLPKKVTLSNGSGQKVVSVNDVLYFESLSRHIIFHLKDGKTFEINDSMEHTLQKFEYPNFFRVHRSFCVNLDHIDNMRPLSLTMTDHTEIPVSRKKQAELRERFMKWIEMGNF